MVPVLVLEWTVKVERVVGNNVFFSSEGKAGRFVFVKGTSQNFVVGTFLKVGIEMVSEPPPLSFSTRSKTVVYGSVRDLVVNGLVISKWNPKTEWSWLKETFKWEEVLVIIDEGMLDKPHFDTGDCVRIKIEKTKGFTSKPPPTEALLGMRDFSPFLANLLSNGTFSVRLFPLLFLRSTYP